MIDVGTLVKFENILKNTLILYSVGGLWRSPWILAGGLRPPGPPEVGPSYAPGGWPSYAPPMGITSRPL